MYHTASVSNDTCYTANLRPLQFPSQYPTVNEVGVMPGHTIWASCQIRRTTGCARAGNAGDVFPATAG